MDRTKVSIAVSGANFGTRDNGFGLIGLGVGKNIAAMADMAGLGAGALFSAAVLGLNGSLAEEVCSPKYPCRALFR